MTLRRDFLAFTAGAVAARTVLPVVAHAAPADPAAELVRLADAIDENDRRSSSLDKERDRTSDRAERARLQAMQEPLTEASWDLRAALAEIPATTMEGFRAKARVVRLYDYEGDGFASPYSQEAVAYSLANDLLGLATVWRTDEA